MMRSWSRGAKVEDDSVSERRGERAEQKFSLGSTLRVREDEVSRDVLSLGGGVKVDGEVFGNAVAVGGRIKVEGKVNGDVIAGSVRMLSWVKTQRSWATWSALAVKLSVRKAPQ